METAKIHPKSDIKYSPIISISPEATNPVSLISPEVSNGKRNHGHLFWLEICWRLASALLLSILIVVILYTFSKKGNLSRWEKRWFNVLTILFSSLVSLMVGSLLGVLGSMLRWQLLARKSHKPIDVRALTHV
jgi:hypothetical protein